MSAGLLTRGLVEEIPDVVTVPAENIGLEVSTGESLEVAVSAAEVTVEVS